MRHGPAAWLGVRHVANADSHGHAQAARPSALTSDTVGHRRAFLYLRQLKPPDLAARKNVHVEIDIRSGIAEKDATGACLAFLSGL